MGENLAAALRYLGATYKDPTVHGGSKLVLNGAGKYFFDRLNFQSNAKLSINHTGEAVELHIRNSFGWRGIVNNTGGRRAAHVVGYYGTDTVYLLSANFGFIGTVVAPSAKLVLGSHSPTAGSSPCSRSLLALR